MELVKDEEPEPPPFQLPYFDMNYDSDTAEVESTASAAESVHNMGKELQLVESLNAVTTHFAHVQFRLRQVIDAPLEEKESLLKDLEEFAFKGVPEIRNLSLDASARSEQIKDHLIANLQKQISELEDSIKRIQKAPEPAPPPTTTNAMSKVEPRVHSSEPSAKKQSKQKNLVDKVANVLHMMNTHCAEEKHHFRREFLQKKIKYHHWGDARAQLELAISEVTEYVLEPEVPIDSDYMSDSDGGSFYTCNQKLVSVVRKKLAPAIQNLMEHGLTSDNKSLSLRSSITFVIGCVPHLGSEGGPGAAAAAESSNAHAWELVLRYYKMKNGDQFNSAPALKLSQSFNLDVGNHCTGSSTQKLLITIRNIISTHSQYKRSFNSQFKAFICAALNAKMLVNWLQLIYRSKTLIEMYYQPWSYALKSGFEDTFKSLEKLQHYHFNLPVDVAIHRLQNIKDAF